MSIEAITMSFAFAVGAVVGSFLNVVIHRVPRGQSVVSPPSTCASCDERIAWYHNVPLLSYLLLRGRCARCGASFSPRYLLVELALAASAVACVAVFGPGVAAARAFAFVAILVALTYIDLEHWLLPHVITWPGIALGLSLSWLPGGPGWVAACIGAAAGFGGFWLLKTLASFLLKKEALGGGDLWLLAMIGAFLGWQALLPVVFLASLQGSIIGGALILIGSRRRGDEGAEVSEDPEPRPVGADGQGSGEPDHDMEEEWRPPAHAVPFGPFLALGALEMLFFGEAVFDLMARAMGLG